MSMVRYAVVGSGPSALAVINGLISQYPKVEIVIFDAHLEAKSRLENYSPYDKWTAEYNQSLYDFLRKEIGLKFPPPKSHFGVTPSSQSVQGWGEIWKSDLVGGLSNFWGASALPFPEWEFDDWVVNRSTLDPHYKSVSSILGISGARDELNRVIGEDFISRPPISVPPIIGKLKESINSYSLRSDFEVVAGLSRLALETRKGSNRSCTYCGQCMTGCHANSLFNAKFGIEELVRQKRVVKVNQKVHGLNLDRGIVYLHNNQAFHFNKIFLGTGCIESTKMVMSSIGLQSGPVMTDNAVYSFPIFYTGPRLDTVNPNEYFSLTNLVSIIHSYKANTTAFLQVYPFFDYLWRAFIPVRYWRYFECCASYMRGRLMWGRFYLDGKYSQRYHFIKKGANEFGMEILNKGGLEGGAELAWHELRCSLNRNGFYVPPFGLIRHKTSSHYAGSLPMGGEWVDESGRCGQRGYICDGAVLNSGSSISPTFTIMANAHRIASLA